MILLKSNETVDFMFRCYSKIDKKSVGSGWLYITNLRIAFESDRYGLCFIINPTFMDSQRSYGTKRFKFTWTESNIDILWRYVFEGKIESWDNWQPSASYVIGVLQDALLPAGAVWCSHKDDMYNQIYKTGKKMSQLGGKTPEEQREYRRWREVWGRIQDMDFDFSHGVYDNSTLERLNKLKIENIQLQLNNFNRKYREKSKTALGKQLPLYGDVVSTEELQMQCVVQKRILQIIQQEFDQYTFGCHIDLRINELRDVLCEMYKQNKDISEYVPPSNVQSAMVQAYADMEKFQERMTVDLPDV